ncbi:MAG: hypothetical protein ACLVCW_02055, partial [Campylobacter sp.]
SGSLNGGNFIRTQNTARYESSAPPTASARLGRTLLRRKEIAELQIIKSMLLDGEMAQLGLGCLERRDFRMHGDIFEAFLAFARSGENFKNFIAGEGGNANGSAFKNFTADGTGENFIRSESVNLKGGESFSEQNFSDQGSAGAINLKGSVQQGANGGEKQEGANQGVNNVAKQGEKKAAAQNIQNAQSVQNAQNVETEALENLRALALDDEILPIGGAALFNDACKILRRNALQDRCKSSKTPTRPTRSSGSWSIKKRSINSSKGTK